MFYLIKFYFRTFKRTEGISTTDIVGRLLLMTRSHHFETFPETKKLRKMSGEEGVAVSNLKEELIVEPEKETKKGEILIKLNFI